MIFFLPVKEEKNQPATHQVRAGLMVKYAPRIKRNMAQVQIIGDRKVNFGVTIKRITKIRCENVKI